MSVHHLVLYPFFDEKTSSRSGFQTWLTKIPSEKCILHFTPHTYTYLKKHTKFYQTIHSLTMNNALWYFLFYSISLKNYDHNKLNCFNYPPMVGKCFLVSAFKGLLCIYIGQSININILNSTWQICLFHLLISFFLNWSFW